MQLFQNRVEAGKILAKNLSEYSGNQNIIVVGIPRGGVPLAYEVALELNVPLDIFLTMKLKLPEEPNISFGAIASGGVIVLNDNIIKGLHIPETIVNKIINQEFLELKNKEVFFRGNNPSPDFENKTVIIVDDGLATGVTIKAAIEALRSLKPSFLLVAVPVASFPLYDEIVKLVDKLVCLSKLEYLYNVGNSYIDYSPVTDQDVQEYLKQYRMTKK